ncbi:hypothetical protein [Prosthecodimorpha staleyi]|uniref:Uncharacterized protein n=1 Tax=Prosthecodimorpha staleyi TaxID=2840188 RepID=A0A947D138_9HYPH|nr:hypothetical protein [Prosthecodimorpha staleyi]MBT9288691.1 hypothetical protein [Prosthecodimorpha staleyi]
MISKDDILGLCGLEADEVDAIAEHEHMPDVAAAALGSYLLHAPHGADRIRNMIVEDLRAALDRGDRDHAAGLFMALRHFLSEHPEAS